MGYPELAAAALAFDATVIVFVPEAVHGARRMELHTATAAGGPEWTLGYNG
jgi:hypothetical protein